MMTPLVPPTLGAAPPFPTWVDDSCQTLQSQPSTPFVRVGVQPIVAKRSSERRPQNPRVPPSGRGGCSFCTYRGEF